MASLWEADSIQISPLADAQYPQFGTSSWQYIFPHSSISADGDVHIDMAVDASGTGSTGNNTGESPIIAEVINAVASQLTHLQSLSGHQTLTRGIFRFYTEHASERHLELHPITELFTNNGASFMLDTSYRSNVVSVSDGTTHADSTLIGGTSASSSALVGRGGTASGGSITINFTGTGDLTMNGGAGVQFVLAEHAAADVAVVTDFANGR